MEGIVAESLTRRFTGRVAVDQIDLSVPPGEILALLGPNGAGKTTTVRMIAALLRPSGGRCRVHGYDIVDQADDVRRIVGLMTDVPALYGDMALRGYLVWFARLYGMAAAAAALRADALVDQFDLAGAADAPLATLSRGTQQKVALARALLHDPHVLLLDEPTASLDVEATLGLRGLFRTLKESGRAVVLCTHNLAEAEKVADSVALLIDGRIAHRQQLQDARARTTYRLRLIPSAPIDLGLLEAIPGVEGGSVVGRGSGVIEYTTRHPNETNPRVASALVGLQAGLIELTPVRESLEDIYLRRLREAGHADHQADRR